MKPPAFRYVAPRTLAEAIDHLASDPDAKILAGGQSFVPILNFRLAHPALLVDVNRIPELAFVERTDSGLRLGATTRHRVLETSPLVRERLPILTEAAALIGHLAIRNRGTIGGSLAHADPAAELPMVAVLLDAAIEATGPNGRRTIPATRFFTAPLTTVLEPNEILTAVELPVLPAGSGHAVVEIARRSGDFAIVAAAATVTLEAGRCTGARIALAGAGLTPIRASAAERSLVGARPSGDAAAAAARLAREAADPTGDLHASPELRLHLTEVLVRRAVEAAFARAAKEAA